MPVIPPAVAAALQAVVASKKTDSKFKKATPKSVAFFYVKRRNCMSDLMEIIKGRRSIRKYQDREVPLKFPKRPDAER